MTGFFGTAGDDHFKGSDGDDSFYMADGGTDTVTGAAGNDTFWFGASFDASDRIDGGDGTNDSLQLDGDYSAGVFFGPNTLRGVEYVELAGGHSYTFGLSDNFDPAGGYRYIDGPTLGVHDSLKVDGHLVTGGVLVMTGGAGDDVLIGGANGDSFNLGAGGTDHAIGGAGGDSFNMGAALDGTDRLDGGDGNDIVNLSGDYSSGVKLLGPVLTDIGYISMGDGFSYKLKLGDADVAAGATLAVGAGALTGTNSLDFNGSAETDGRFAFYDGHGSDRLTGGAGADQFIISGGGGRDVLTGGAGAGDSFYFSTVADTPANAPDRITDLKASDLIDLNGIDADSTAPGDQAFTLVKHFSHTAGEAVLHYVAATDTTTLSMDVNGDGLADARILLDGDHSGFTNFAL